MKRTLFFIAQKDFQEEEFFETKQVLEEADIFCDVVSSSTDVCLGKFGSNATPTTSLEFVEVLDYDAFVFVGGPGALELGEDFRIKEIFVEAFNSGKIIAGICIAPAILSNYGILKGKKSTVFKSSLGINTLKENEVEYVDEDVVVDGEFITANGPDAAKNFGDAIRNKLLEN